MPNPDWLEEAYTSAIACTDTGIAARNLMVAERLVVLLYFWLKERGGGCYLDVAGGSGLLVRLMRDAGFDFFWSDKYASNVFSAGFEWRECMRENGCAAVTAIEVLEHTIDPVGFIESALSTAGSKTIIFSTATYQGSPPPVSMWGYYSLNTGQHISFFAKRTLQEISRLLSANYVGCGDFHVISRCLSMPSDFFMRMTVSRARKVLLPFARLPSRMISDHESMVRCLSEKFLVNKDDANSL